MAPVSVFRSFLVPVDGSAASDDALRFALRLVAWDGEVIIAHVIDRAAPAAEAQGSPERGIFARAAGQARAAGVSFSTVSHNGAAVAGITFLATNRDADAIVMGTHGRSGVARMLLGNTAAGVVRETSVPVFVVHEQSAEIAAHPLRTIVVALDPSAAARRAAHAAVDLAAADDGRVVFAHVASPADDPIQAKAFADAAAYALAAGVPSDALVLQGRPGDAIINGAQSCHADLIAIGAHGCVEKPFGFGSVAQEIVRRSRVPVLVTPAPVTAAMSGAPREAGSGSP